MEAVAKVCCRHQPLKRSLHRNRPLFSRPISSLSFSGPPPPLALRSPLSVEASSSTTSSSSSTSPTPLFPNPKSPKPHSTETLNPFPFSLLRTTVIAASTVIAAATVLFARFNLKIAIAAPILPPAVAENIADEDASKEDKEKALEEYADSHPDDVQALRDLMDAKVKSRKMNEAIAIVERLIMLEPEEQEWPLLKAHMHCYNDQFEIAEKEFNEIASNDPSRAEAYHGLVMVASQAESDKELKEIEKRIAKAMEICKKEKKENQVRDFKLLIAQIRVMEGDYSEALTVYQELVKEEPRDFRPYLCQVIIYTLLRKKDEAEEQFQKYRRLVPQGHPYAEYFDDNVMATKLFAQKVENEEHSRKG